MGNDDVLLLNVRGSMSVMWYYNMGGVSKLEIFI